MTALWKSLNNVRRGQKDKTISKHISVQKDVIMIKIDAFSEAEGLQSWGRGFFSHNVGMTIHEPKGLQSTVRGQRNKAASGPCGCIIWESGSLRAMLR